MFDALRFEDLSQHVNSKFRISEDDYPFELELIEAVEIANTPEQEVFSLIFLGPGVKQLEQRMYQLSHDKLGAGVVFLVPIGQDAAGVRYEAAFNRMVNRED